MSLKLEDVITKSQCDIAKYQTVLQHFPDARFYNHKYQFRSKKVNQQYNKLLFEKSYSTLRVIPYCEIPFQFNGKSEFLIVNSSPRDSRLAYLSWYNHKYIIKFSKLSFNLKNNNFKEDMLNDCRVSIMNFIKDYPKYDLDTTHLEPKLKKLIFLI